MRIPHSRCHVILNELPIAEFRGPIMKVCGTFELPLRTLAEKERQRKSDKIGVEKEIGMAFGHEKLDRCSRNACTCRRSLRGLLCLAGLPNVLSIKHLFPAHAVSPVGHRVGACRLCTCSFSNKRGQLRDLRALRGRNGYFRFPTNDNRTLRAPWAGT